MGCADADAQNLVSSAIWLFTTEEHTKIWVCGKEIEIKRGGCLGQTKRSS